MKELLLTMSLLSFIGLAGAQNFSEGQVWHYKTRKGEESSTVLIDKVETYPKIGKVFHISISGVKVRNPHIAGGVSTELPHLPVSEKTLKESVTKQTGRTAPNPAYLEGYKVWKEAFDDGKAGVFSIKLADVVDTVEGVINQ